MRRSETLAWLLCAIIPIKKSRTSISVNPDTRAELRCLVASLEFELPGKWSNDAALLFALKVVDEIGVTEGFHRLASLWIDNTNRRKATGETPE